MAQSLFKISDTLTSSQIGKLSGGELDYELVIKGLAPGSIFEDNRKS